MKTKIVLSTAAAGLLSSAAFADVTLNLGNFDLAPGQDVFINVPNLTGTLTTWTVTFDYLGNTDASWSSDALFSVADPNGGGWETNGFDRDLGYEEVGLIGQDDGSAGTFSGTFDGATNVSGTGTWVMSVGDGWSGGSETSSYHNVEFILRGVDIVPAPGALALLGAAGVLARRRRRA